MTKKVVHYKLEVVSPKVKPTPDSTTSPVAVEQDNSLEIIDTPTLIRQTQLGESLQNISTIPNLTDATGQEWEDEWDNSN
jgi:hypothetical protein